MLSIFFLAWLRLWVTFHFFFILCSAALQSMRLCTSNHHPYRYLLVYRTYSMSFFFPQAGAATGTRKSAKKQAWQAGSHEGEGWAIFFPSSSSFFYPSLSLPRFRRQMVPFPLLLLKCGNVLGRKSFQWGLGEKGGRGEGRVEVWQ